MWNRGRFLVVDPVGEELNQLAVATRLLEAAGLASVAVSSPFCVVVSAHTSDEGGADG